jgi:agmatine deiminase
MGYRMPAEWEAVEAVWMSWPVREELWRDHPRVEVERHLVDLAALIARFTTVRVCVEADKLARVSALLPEAEVFAIATDDVWCRDHGPTFLKNLATGEVATVDWAFNAWGGKFPYEKDAQVARKIAEALGIRSFVSELVCEGGALESNGAGKVLTTASVLLNENRNPGTAGWSQEKVTCELQKQLGISEVIWLRAGLENDDTDGHIDMVARFVGENEVLVVEPVTEILAENVSRLQAAGLQVTTMPAVGDFADGIDGSYANFLIVNQGVIVPQYNLVTDQQALKIIQSSFPNHEVVGFDCSLLGHEGGAVHCLTQGQWR